MLTAITLILAAIIVAILILASTKPNAFSISRSITIDASPERIYPLVSDLRAHRSWSPFDQDPKMKRDYTGPETGKGSTFFFDNGMASTGHLSITDTSAPSKVEMNLVMTKPLKCDNAIAFTFAPQGNATHVTWTMSGPNTFASKLMNVFMDCNKMCAQQFDTGLASLKKLAETPEGRSQAA